MVYCVQFMVYYTKGHFKGTRHIAMNIEIYSNLYKYAEKGDMKHKFFVLLLFLFLDTYELKN